MRELPLRARTDYLLRRFGLRPRKSLGQNFLINEGAARRLAQAATVAGWPVLEIGGGLGALTVPLAASGVPLRVVEIDAALAEVLRWLTSDLPHVAVTEGDALELGAEDFPEAPATAIGNLPYLSGGAILQALWAEEAPFRRIVATVQREVAERLRAAPGTKAYGPLSVLAAAHLSAVEVLAQLGPGSFLPPPTVSSTALLLSRRRERPPGLSSYVALDLAVRGAFSARRKTLENSLKLTYSWDATTVAEVLGEVSLDGKRRGETLNLAELVALGEALSGRLSRTNEGRG